ncbi:hypothetical protein G6O67_007662 [Ophiocordyceps sinensis]|uniref:SCP domain-containing protein n=1 Tax=Ophiocordyceps sinensis TaxID=72228 RepID=A0A8H4LUT3_9HYPO|nr:hypothetical protein G6O67_007662 [Ophiocordyceps sinensis]
MRCSIFFFVLPLVAALPGAQSTDKPASKKRWLIQQGSLHLSPLEVQQRLAQGWQGFQITQIDPEWTLEKMQQLASKERTEQPGQPFKDDKQNENGENRPLENAYPQVPSTTDRLRPGGSQDESVVDFEGNAVLTDRLKPGDSQDNGQGVEAFKEKTAPTDFINQVLALHNAARTEYGLDETQMLTWSNDAAAAAQRWAEGCWRDHPQTRYPFAQNIASASKSNQTLFGGSDPELEFDMKAMWHAYEAFKAEEQSYDFTIQHRKELFSRGEDYFEKVGHFLIMVSKELGQVGCGSHYCPVLRDERGNAWEDEVFVVCNYLQTVWMTDEDPNTVPHKVQA